MPAQVVAGAGASIGTSGSGGAIFYLVGPGVSLKKDVKLGEEIALSPKETQKAGKYTAIVCANVCESSEFFVSPAASSKITLLAHPSRAPVGMNDVISGVALPFDEFHNLVLAPTTIDFQLSTHGEPAMNRPVSTHNGVAWFRTDSGKTAGTMQIIASLGQVSTRHVVQQVASNPCNLHIQGQRTAKGIVVETSPVRDCAGNPVPDGTIVTFTATAGQEKSTVDAPIKQGIARAQILTNGPVMISAASGVVMGNELRLGGGQ